MEKQYKDFGDFLHQKRTERKISYRDLGKIIGVEAPYISDIEKGRRNAPSMEKLKKISAFFELSKEEEDLMYNLAGDKAQIVPPDLPEYIVERHYVSNALRTAKDLDANEEDWNMLVEELKRRKGAAN